MRGMAVLCQVQAPKHVDMDTAVKIDEAIFLPEPGGVWTESLVVFNPESDAFGQDTQERHRIGRVGVERPHIKNPFLTRNLLQGSTANHAGKDPTPTSQAPQH